MAEKITLHEYLEQPVRDGIAERKRRKALIMKNCGISNETLRNYRYNISPVPLTVAREIERITGQEFDFNIKQPRKKKNA